MENSWSDQLRVWFAILATSSRILCTVNPLSSFRVIDAFVFGVE